MRIGLVTFSLALSALWAGACSSGSSGTGGSNPAGSSGGLDDSGGGSSSGAGSSGTSSGNASSSGSATSSGSGGGSNGGSTSSGASSGGGDAAASSGSSSGGGDASAVSGPYPSGPYCAPAGSAGHLAVGCVLPNTTWVGYDDPSGVPIMTDAGAGPGSYAPYTLDQARKSGKRYAMINVAEFDCPGCQNSATELGSGGAAVEHAGGLIIEVLETTGFIAISSRSDLDYWVNHYMLEVTTVKDPDNSTGTPSLNFFGRRDQAYIVDLQTMTILQYINGSIAAQTTNSAGLAIQQMDILLGVADH